MTAKAVVIVRNATVNVAMNNKMAFMTVQGHNAGTVHKNRTLETVF